MMYKKFVIIEVSAKKTHVLIDEDHVNTGSLTVYTNVAPFSVNPNPNFPILFCRRLKS